MNRSRWTGLFTLLSGAAVALGGLGCTYTCEEAFRCPPEDERPACPEDPAASIQGEVPAGCGLWVSSSQGNDGNLGTQEEPLATLAEAAARAAQGDGPRRVYACGEKFEQPVQWPAGVALHGGYACAGLDWRYSRGNQRTTIAPPAEAIAPPADAVALTLTGSTLPEPALLTDLKVESPDAGWPGSSSIAVLALADARADLRRCELVSGRGADGLDGDDSDHFGVPAKDGVHGHNGAPACSNDVGNGGEMVALDCDGDDASFGGRGGDGGAQVATAGDDGEVAPAGNPQGYGLAGVAEDLAAGLFCTGGIVGAAGKDGEPGAGAAAEGARLTASGYVGVRGGDGQRGRAGQGGGGGGATAGTAACGSWPGGAGGGSGGAGGCGGKGGRGGGPGGASIALAMLTQDLVATAVTLTAGRGGNGGRGGLPQQGGGAGLPGIGGAGLPAPGGANPGCAGGAGGYGGDGGHAGGGLGGPSIALAYVGAQPSSFTSSWFTEGQKGDGGPGSDPELTLLRGEDGKAAKLEALLP